MLVDLGGVEHAVGCFVAEDVEGGLHGDGAGAWEAEDEDLRWCGKAEVEGRRTVGGLPAWVLVVVVALVPLSRTGQSARFNGNRLQTGSKDDCVIEAQSLCEIMLIIIWLVT